MAQRRGTLQALRTWRDSLIGLDRRSRLIRFRPPKTSSLTFDTPSADEILNLIRSGRLLELTGDKVDDEGNVVTPARRRNSLHTPRPEAEIGPVARTLMRRANEEFLDRGLSVLYVAFGMLRWKDIDDTDMASPLYLTPVELVPEGPRATPRIKGSDDDPVLNPALPLRLADFGVKWPTIEEAEDLSANEILELFRHAIGKAADFKDWRITPEVNLSTFSFTKEAMYNDLRDNESLIAEHPVVRALANTDPTQQTDAFRFDPVDPADIDAVAPPEKTPLVLDADSSQRAAVAAALTGRSFVMDGPPGTGKSQTIANMIGALMHAGKTVLFVSEKIAALDVVRNRLDDAGLGSYLLELHSHKTNRREVAVELMKTLDHVAQPPSGMAAPSRAALEDRRRKLSDYADAMNEIRSPLELSLHDVLGTLADLVHLPAAPVPERPPLDLDQAGLAALENTLRHLERTWRPAAQGRSFLWRDVIEESSLESRLWGARSALEELKGTVALNTRLISEFDLDRPDRAQTLISLLELQHLTRPAPVSDRWLTRTDWATLQSACRELSELVTAHRDAASTVIALSDKPYDEFSNVPRAAPGDIKVPGAIDLEPLRLAALTSTKASLDQHASSLSAAATSLDGLSHAVGIPSPVTFADADRILRLVELRSAGDKVEPTWFTAHILQSARDAATTARLAAMKLDAAESQARNTYRPEALTAPLNDLQDRFENLHKGLRKLSGAYRADKRAVATLLSDAKQVRDGISRLSDAIAWSDANKEFEAVAVMHAPALGGHWSGRDTDWDSLERAFAVVEEVIALVAGPVSPETIAFFTVAQPVPTHLQVANTARASLEAWQHSLAPAPALAGRPELLLQPIESSLSWITAHNSVIVEASTLVGAVNAVTDRDHSLAEAKTIMYAVDHAEDTAHALDAFAPRLDAELHGLYDGAHTDLADVEAALEWARSVRRVASGALTEDQAASLASSSFVDGLAPSLANWESARDAIVSAFGDSRQAELLDDFATFSGAFELLDEFGADTVGQQEWFDYTQIRENLQALQLGPTMDFCIENRVSAADVPRVILRALLRAWADAQIKADERLHPVTSSDREAIVNEFRTLDLKLIAAATGDIIRAANFRRPTNTSLGEPAIIRREGMKQRRHIPVRSLISQARSAIQAIKPVFMMSPLAVSQYLPSDMKFDVVIFDEASQVTPGDSINCIYRGRAFILAGDDKQLPPTQFFERIVETDDESEVEADVQDFQSILELAKAAGAFQNLGLRWHYRSRHEALIGFSNYRFYDGKLITYPSAQDDGPDVGVEFFLTDGVYRRGGGADNPREATAVAERVIHHYRTRPGLSVGVVTFSVAQADAVMVALNKLRESHRDLDGHFDRSDRLDGFFVRSLESVQGDERDVIIFSIGYGPDEAGKISTNFGVLNKEKGWRRLNVGITRARQRVEVISSMEAHDVPPSTNENVEALRAYLDFARRGISVLGTQSSTTGLMPESPFEESVIRTIESWGYTVEPQVGAAGFRLDIGVRHPAKPGMFAIGVECDGYQYHSSPAARDRDRLRDQVLQGLGWTLHRIWGTAWYRDRPTEEKRLRAAIDDAISGKSSSTRRHRAALLRQEINLVPATTEDNYGWAFPYEEASVVRLPYWVEPAEPGNYLHMVDALKAIAKVEGPVHMDTVSERIRDWWSVGRVSQRLKENLDRAIRAAELHRDGDFIDVPDRTMSKVRCRDNSRKPEHVHLDEFALAAESLVRDVGGASRSEIVTHVARLYGWARNGAILDGRLNQAIDRAIAKGRLVENDGKLGYFP